MKELLSKTWWLAAGTRAFKTFFQTFLANMTVGGAVIGSSDVTLVDIQWWHIASVAAVSAIYSLITSLAGIPEATTETETSETQEDESDTIPPTETEG